MLNNTQFGSARSEDTTIISHGVKIEGKVKSNGNIRVDGEIQGDIISQGNVSIGVRAQVNGQINADAITISGKVSGVVIAKEKLILDSKGNVKGDIYTKNLTIETGAKFDGNSRTGDVKDMGEIQNIIKKNSSISKMPMEVNPTNN